MMLIEQFRKFLMKISFWNPVVSFKIAGPEPRMNIQRLPQSLEHLLYAKSYSTIAAMLFLRLIY